MLIIIVINYFFIYTGIFTKSDVDSIVQESIKMKSFDHLNVLSLIGIVLILEMLHVL